MLVKTSSDLKNALFALASGSIAFDQIEFADFIEDSIKIDTNEWGCAGSINYRVAEYLLALQKDIIKLYNFAYNESLTIKDLKNYQFLIVNLTIEDGCVKLISKISKYLFDFMKDMNPSQKVITVVGMTIAVACMSAPFIIRELRKSNILPSETIDKIDTESAKISTAPKVLINNTGNGVVIYSNNDSMDYDELKRIYHRGKQEKNDIPPVDIDDKYAIVRYDFDAQKAFLVHSTGESFWASTNLLNTEKREKLKKLTTDAIDRGTTMTAELHVTATIHNKKIENATILGINVSPREGSLSLRHALYGDNEPQQKENIIEQGNLLSYFSTN